ncbi:DUF222 domain-containing protein [Kribbella sp. NPDC056861]|uniref:HNH endonuclease signature motif containing protein n=1 Tax=Kribbella sp. NPDC056861 TaxID=3154857 RepID=UPI00342B599D
MNDRAVVLMSGSELLTAYDALHEELEELKARQAHILNRLDQIGYAAEVGAHDTARLITHRYRLDPTEAHRRVHFATRLHKYPAVAAALATSCLDRTTGDDDGGDAPIDGDCGDSDSGESAVVLHMGQAEAIVSALDKIPARANVAVEDLAEAELRMVEASEHLSPSGLRTLGVQVRNLLDTDGPEPREDAARRREELWTKKTDDGGLRFGGFYAAENAEALETVLQTGAKPHNTDDGDPDPRSRGKRQADALMDALTIALNTGDLPARGGIKPHITVTIDLNDLLEAGQHATGALAFGDGLSAAAVRRLACDAGIIPIVLGSAGQLLDVGRENRLVTPAIRNALNVRDRGCVVCHAPPIYCDAHHVTSWAEGGDTSLANMVLLCRVDHTSLHQGHWTVTIEDDQVQVTPPAWANRPPGRHRKPATPSPAAPAPLAATDADTCPPPPKPTTTTTAAAICHSPEDAAANATSPSPTTTGADPAPCTTAGTNPAPCTTAGTNPAPCTTAGTEPAPSTTAGTEPTPSTTAGTEPTPSTTAGTEPTPSTTAGTEPVLSTTAGTDPTPCTTADVASDPCDITGTDPAPPTPTPTRRWPHTNDVTWITPEEAATYDPWPDTA